MKPEHVVELIVNRDIDELRRLIDEAFLFDAHLFAEGYITERERQRLMLSFELLGKALKRIGLREDWLRYDSWLSFKEDYDRAERGEALRRHNMDWLTTLEGLGASPEDKEFVLAVYRATRVPVSSFEPCPPGILAMRDMILRVSGATTVSSLELDCVDDGGLSRDENPTGKTYVLVDADGTRAHVTIDDKPYKACDREDRRRPISASGWIDGYTAGEGREHPEIEIYLDEKGCPVRLKFAISNTDEKARSSSPIWRDYFAWGNEVARRVEEEWSAVFDEYDRRQEHERPWEEESH